jgi:hypothetical protein
MKTVYCHVLCPLPGIVAAVELAGREGWALACSPFIAGMAQSKISLPGQAGGGSPIFFILFKCEIRENETVTPPDFMALNQRAEGTDNK